MSQKANYFKIGLFVISAVTITVIAVIVLGVGALFRDKIYIETYLDESVQGLDIGSPVKYRGVQLGVVEDIDLVGNYYYDELNDEERDKYSRYVLLKMAVYTDLLGKRYLENENKLLQQIQKMKENGFRLRMASQGVTGIYYIEGDYIDPDRNPPLEVSWEPDHYYIPSAPSTITKLLNSVDAVFTRIEDLNIEGIALNLENFLASLTNAVEDARFGKLSSEIEDVLLGIQSTLTRLQEILGDDKFDSIPGDLSDTVANAKNISENLDKELSLLFVDLGQAGKRINSITEKLDEFVAGEEGKEPLKSLASTLDNVESASEDLPQSIEHLKALLKKVDRLISGEQKNIEEILENIRLVSENLKEFTDNAKKYPSQVFFGEPPAKEE